LNQKPQQVDQSIIRLRLQPSFQ